MPKDPPPWHPLLAAIEPEPDAWLKAQGLDPEPYIAAMDRFLSGGDWQS